MRFDSIDPEAVTAGGLSVGSSELYATALGAAPPPLRLLLTDAQQRQQKPLTVQQESCSVERVLKDAKRLLNLRRKPSTLISPDGQTVDDVSLRAVQHGTVLLVK